MDVQPAFGAILRRLREEKELTQGQLAKMCSLSRLQIIRLEMDQQGASWVTVQKLAQALGVDCRAFTEEEPGQQPELIQVDSSKAKKKPARKKGKD